MSTWISQGVLRGSDGAPGSTGPAGGVFGSVIADFGSSDNGGSDAMSVTVTVAASWLTSTSYPIVELVSGADHLDADDLTSEEVYAFVTNIQTGTSFDVEVFAPNGTQGQWLVNWGAAVTGSNDPTKASTSTTISAGDGLSGGGSLAANRSLAVDGTVVRTSRTITAGDGLSGGGDLSANRTLAVDGTVGRTGGTSHYYDYDELIGAGPKFCALGDAGASGSISAMYTGNLGTGHTGGAILSPGTTASKAAWLNANTVYLAGQTITWRAWVDLSAAAGSSTQHFVGLCDSVTLGLPASGNYIGIYWVRANGANWQAYTRTGSTTAQQDTGVPGTIGTFFDLKIVATTSSVAFWINNVLTNTISTGIPVGTVGMYPSVWIYSSADTANYAMYIDAVEIDINSGIAGKFSKTPI
jgi:hypothetical protein